MQALTGARAQRQSLVELMEEAEALPAAMPEVEEIQVRRQCCCYFLVNRRGLGCTVHVAHMSLSVLPSASRFLAWLRN